MDRLLLINALTVAIIFLEGFWAFTDPRSKTERAKYYFSLRGLIISAFAFLFVVLNYASAIYFPLPDSAMDNFLMYSGLLIFILGITISFWAKVTMGKIWGVPAHMRKDQNKLIKHGPFQYTRNPIYVGLVMVLIGYGLALQSWFIILALIPIFYFNYAAQKEEKLLEKHFGNEYLKYKKEVPRFF